MDKEEAKGQIVKLVKQYKQALEEGEFTGTKTNEENTKSWIDELFSRLGWKIRVDVTKEELAGRKKRVDYAFRIDGTIQFLLEAKSVEENLDNYINQALNYGYLRDVDWVVLTNFKEIRVYNSKYFDKEEQIRRLFIPIKIEEFESRFEDLWLLSKSAFIDGLIYKEAVKYGKIKPKEPVTVLLSNDMLHWRTKLTSTISAYAKENNLPSSSDESIKLIDECVQRILDRILFIRVAEDRRVEKESRLLPLVNSWDNKKPFMPVLKSLFREMDTIYNSGLFHPHISENLKLNEPILVDIIKETYENKDKVPYDFKVIPADVLGAIYEQYLGSILTKSEKKEKIEPKILHRKKQGIYYTPRYVVDYIVTNTIMKAIEGKKLDSLESFKVLDPACGSGSFLIKAFESIDKYYQQKDKNYKQSKLNPTRRLTTQAKIMQNNIYGIDLDEKAVEITQLNLLLNMAETRDRLPELNKNIKLGNSLVDDLTYSRFDAVIGNPPWGADLGTSYSYLTKKFSDVSIEEVDSYKMFIKQGLMLTKDNGYFSFIVPNSLLYSIRYRDIRKLLLQYKIERLVDLGDKVFGDEVTAPCCIFIIKKQAPDAHIIIQCCDISDLKDNNAKAIKILDHAAYFGINELKFKDTPYNSFNLNLSPIKDKILEKMKIGAMTFGQICDSCDAGINYKTVGRGKIRGGAIGEKFLYKGKKENKDDIPYIRGSDINRYSLTFSNNYMRGNFEQLIDRKNGDVVGFNKNYFSLSEKIVSRQTSAHLIATYDNHQLYTNRTLHSHKIKDDKEKEFPLKFVLGLMNSKLLDFYYQQIKSKRGVGRAMPQVNLSFLRQLPIKDATGEEKEKMTKLVDKILILNRQIVQFGGKQTNQRNRIEEEIMLVDKEIDNLVYKIYGITEEEKKVIETAVS